MIEVLIELACSASWVEARLEEPQSHPPVMGTSDISGISTDTDLECHYESSM